MIIFDQTFDLISSVYDASHWIILSVPGKQDKADID